MNESNDKQRFLGTYFDRDNVLRISRAAEVIAWIILTIYIVSWLFSLMLFLAQFSKGLYVNKGMTFLDTFSFFKPYLVEPLPGVMYYFALQGISKALLILLDMEDNTRRGARK